MSAIKRWKQLSGGTFFKFATPGDHLEGIWRGTQPSKFDNENGLVETSDGELKQFTMNAALKDLSRVPLGTEVQITFTGKAMSKAGKEFKVFQILVEDGADVTEAEPF